jgi:putative flippase GtrA
MRIHNLIIIFSTCLITSRSIAQTEQNQTAKYHHFAVYAGVGPSFFFNNLVAFKNDVNPLGWEFSARFMWEPRGSFLSLGIETGYYHLYSASSTEPINAKAIISSIPIQFVVSMKFSHKIYANWSMGQSIQYNKVVAPDNSNNFNNHVTSLADFSATVGYRFIQKERISYAAEFKGYYSSAYANGTIALLFIVGYRL